MPLECAFGTDWSASRSGVPIEIVSEVTLRYANLLTAQSNLGRVSDVEAMTWIENLCGPLHAFVGQLFHA